MPKVSAKEFQRRIADLDAQYIIAQPKQPSRIFGSTLALIIFALIAVAAFSYANRTSPEFTRLTLKQGTIAPKPLMSDAEAQAKWDAVWGAASTGIKRGE